MLGGARYPASAVFWCLSELQKPLQSLLEGAKTAPS